MIDKQVLNWDMPENDQKYNIKESLKAAEELLLISIDDTRAGSVIHQNTNYLLGWFIETFKEVLEDA